MDILERKLDQLLQHPTDGTLINDIGAILYQFNDLINAEKYLELAYKLNSKDLDTIFNYGFVLYERGKLKSASDILSTYLDLNSDDKEVIKIMGDIYYQLSKYDLAAKMYEQLSMLREVNSE